MADLVAAAERALATDTAFERRDDVLVATSTPFDATVRVTSAGGSVGYHVEMQLPTLDAVVADESVPEVVREGWFETFDRRLEDVDGALRADVASLDVELDETAGTVTVTASFESDAPERGADDVAALVGYIEGTYMEGIIPGYTYREPVSSLLEAAYERSGASRVD